MLYLLLIRLLLSDVLTWHGPNEGMERAKALNKPILMDVYTDWCSWCKVMDQKTYNDEDIVNYLKKNFILVKMNPETDGNVRYREKSYAAAEFASGLGITGYPATAFFESDGRVITIASGYIEAKEFLPMLQYIAEKKYNEISYQDFLKQTKP